MANSAPNRSLVARASAILTNAAVAATKLDLNEAADGSVKVQVDFTVGMLTNVILRGYVSPDNVTWYQLFSGDSTSLAALCTLTGTNTICLNMPSLGGMKWFRMTAEGTGTLTSSLLTLTYRYLRRGTR